MSLQQSAWGARHATGCEAHICGPCMQQGYQHLPVPTGLLHKRQPGLGSSWPRSPFPPFQDTPVSPQRWARCCTLNRMPPPRRAGPSHTHTCQCEGCDACLHAIVVASVVHSRRDAVLDAGRVKLAGGCAGLDVGPAASTGKVGYARYTGQRSSKRAASGRHALLEWQGRARCSRTSRPSYAHSEPGEGCQGALRHPTLLGCSVTLTQTWSPPA